MSVISNIFSLPSVFNKARRVRQEKEEESQNNINNKVFFFFWTRKRPNINLLLCTSSSKALISWISVHIFIKFQLFFFFLSFFPWKLFLLMLYICTYVLTECLIKIIKNLSFLGSVLKWQRININVSIAIIAKKRGIRRWKTGAKRRQEATA